MNIVDTDSLHRAKGARLIVPGVDSGSVREGWRPGVQLERQSKAMSYIEMVVTLSGRENEAQGKLNNLPKVTQLSRGKNRDVFTGCLTSKPNGLLETLSQTAMSKRKKRRVDTQSFSAFGLLSLSTVAKRSKSNLLKEPGKSEA